MNGRIFRGEQLRGRIVGNRRDSRRVIDASPDIAHLSVQRRSDNEGWNTSPLRRPLCEQQLLLVQVRSTVGRVGNGTIITGGRIRDDR